MVSGFQQIVIIIKKENSMLQKVMSFKGKARAKLLAGVEILAEAVTTTLGPKGRNVAIQRQYGLPVVVHDGVTVAREVGSKDPLEMIGINLVREASQRTNDEAGDGTTTSTLLAHQIVKRGMKLLDDGKNPMTIRKEMYSALPGIIEKLKGMSIPVTDKKDVEAVALISSADTEIGTIVAEAVDHVGTDGLVTVEEGQGTTTEVQYTEGMEFSRGWIAPHFITNENRLEAVIEDPIIILADKSISLAAEITSLLNAVVKIGKNIVIIAKDVQGDALATLVVNKQKGNLSCVAVRAPGNTNEQLQYLTDMAIVTGGTVISDSNSPDPTKPEEWTGKAKTFIAGRERSVIVHGAGDKAMLEERIQTLRDQIAGEKSVFVKEQVQMRLARLTKGVAVIKVGAKTELDMREKVERVKDAIGAATAAREEGTLIGGGMSLYKIGTEMKPKTPGEQLLKEVLMSPVSKILDNAGYEGPEKELMLKTIAKSPVGEGYNMETDLIEDLRKAGVIDPTKVVRLALENAVGVGTSILTTDAIIAIEDDGKKEE